MVLVLGHLTSRLSTRPSILFFNSLTSRFSSSQLLVQEAQVAEFEEIFPQQGLFYYLREQKILHSSTRKQTWTTRMPKLRPLASVDLTYCRPFTTHSTRNSATTVSAENTNKVKNKKKHVMFGPTPEGKDSATSSRRSDRPPQWTG
jgi:hypothetical protein